MTARLSFCNWRKRRSRLLAPPSRASPKRLTPPSKSVANGTYADGSSAAIINGASVNLPLVNLSKYSANATLYYETERWGARISEAYRGKYLDSAGGNGNIGEGYEATNNVDFTAHYNITPHFKATL